MSLIPDLLKATLPRLYATENLPNEESTVQIKLFTPWSYWSWYVIEAEQQEDGDWLCFGLVCGHETELGYFSLNELEDLRGPADLTIERDLYFEPLSLHELMVKLKQA